MDASEISDKKPESDEFYKNIWLKTAVDNSEYFWKCFRNLPHNTVTKYLNETSFDYINWQNKYGQVKTKSIQEKTEILQNIKGYIINYQRKNNRPCSLIFNFKTYLSGDFAKDDVSITTTSQMLDAMSQSSPIFL